MESDIHYLVVDSSDVMIMTNYRNTFQSTIKRASTSWSSDVETKIADLNDLIRYIKDVKSNLENGLASGLTWSGVMAKHSIGNMLKTLYSTELEKAAKSGDVSSFNEGKIVGTLFTESKEYLSWKQKNPSEKVDELVKNVQTEIDGLMNFLINNYYKNIKYGKTNQTIELKVVETNPNEEDGYSFTDKTNGNKIKYISGIGLNSSDIEQKDIGIGFSGRKGQNVYNALLQKHTNISDVTTSEQYKLGLDQVKDIKTSMENVAKFIANLKVGQTGEWKETYYYDQDSSGETYGSVEKKDQVIRKSDGTIDLKVFFEWLNSDQFFNGRDMRKDQFPTIDGTTPLNNWIANNTNPTSTDTSGKTAYKYTSYEGVGQDGKKQDLVRSVIGYQGDTDAEKTQTSGDAGNLYVKYINEGLTPSTIQNSTPEKFTSSSKSISPAAAYIGASNAVSQYLTYKQATAENLSKAFKDTPVNYTLRTATGGAAYASSGNGGTTWIYNGPGGFYLDVNPYFGLQKWSMSTLSNHEGVTGHVYQFNYAATHPANENTLSIRSTAYAEGWGLFSEWLAVQSGVYGKPADLKTTAKIENDEVKVQTQGALTLPSFGENSKTNDITKLDTTYANGVYALEVKANDSTSKELKNNQAYYDALQYFGFLNERQLRAMRITVDVGLHAGENGSYRTGSGYSLKQAREYLQSNSGLGIDDINRETKRYLEYTAQATSYFNGLIEIQDYFAKAKGLFEQNNPGKKFMNWEDLSSTKKNTQDLFDLILRNGNQPIESLTWAVDQYLIGLYKK